MVNRRLAICIILIFGIIYAIFPICMEREGDGLEYAFMVPENAESNNYEYVESVADVFKSQCVHYRTVNGRFALHVAVQIFCGLLPQWMFGVVNGIMFILTVVFCGKFSGANLRHPGVALTLSALIFFYICRTTFDAAYQVGYLWSSAAISGFLLLYKRMGERPGKKVARLILCGVIGLFCGSLHEAFSVPVSILLITHWIIRGWRLTPAQYSMAICFGIGALVELAAPGNFVRLETYTQDNILARIFFIVYHLNMLWLLALAILIARRQMKKCGNEWSVKGYYNANKTYLIAIGVSIMVFAIAGLVYLNTMQGVNLLLTLVILRTLPEQRLNKLWSTLAVAAVVVVIISLSCEMALANTKYREIKRQYFNSDDGIVELPQPLYGYDYRTAEALCIPITWVARAENPSFPEVHIYPEGLKGLKEDADTSYIRTLGDQGWLMVNSKHHPHRFFIEKYLFGKRVDRHPVEFNADALGFVAESDNWCAVAYCNEHKALFEAKVTMEE